MNRSWHQSELCRLQRSQGLLAVVADDPDPNFPDLAVDSGLDPDCCSSCYVLNPFVGSGSGSDLGYCTSSLDRYLFVDFDSGSGSGLDHPADSILSYFADCILGGI